MKRIAGALGLTAAIGLTLPAVPASAGGFCQDAVATKGSGATVRMEENCFVPTVLRAPSGAEVTFANIDPAPHTITGIGPWGTGHKEVPADARFSLTFGEDGVYVYTCLVHPGMAGAIVVGNPSGPGAAEGPDVDPGELEDLVGATEEREAADDAAPDTLERVGGGGDGASLEVPGIAAGVALAAGGLGFGLGRRRRA